MATPAPSTQRAQPLSVMNYVTGEKRTDTLLTKTAMIHPTGCTERRCIGSQMLPKRRNIKVPYSMAEKKELAKDFLQQYYQFLKSENSPEHKDRLAAVMTEIDHRGTYDLSFKELNFGCRTAWRNAPRCMNRIQWRKLVVFDQRDVRTAEEMFTAMVHHIRFCSNPEKPGVLRSTITVFPEAVDEDHEYRVWNTQFIRYAGYRMTDGSILGDPASVDFTDVCTELGWKPPKEQSQCDVLPLVLQANGGSPQLFELEKEDILEVPLTHPQYPAFDQLKLKWYGIPGVSCLMLEIGGLRFTAAPFNGWYLVTEIGARDLGDPMRYNMLEKMAKIMKLDIQRDQLWKDKALVELNAAVLQSYNKHGVSILDHHSGAESFMKFMEQEYRERGGCPADWVWIVPPMSGSATPVYHQEMLVYHLSPSFEYQDDPWVKWRQAKQPVSSSKGQAKKKFLKVARSTMRLNHLLQLQMRKRIHCTILYATETGHSETYAKMLQKLFDHAFKCELYCMESYPVGKIETEELVLVVAGTFGSGEPPTNGEEFAQMLISMQAPQFPVRQRRVSVVLGNSWNVAKKDTMPLSSVKFAVFGLGSRAYPDTFCAFGHTVDKLLGELGGERIFSLGEGDELCGQAETFRNWAMKCYEATCKYYALDLNLQPAESPLMSREWGKNKFRLRKVEPPPRILQKADHLKQFHNCPKLLCAKLVDRKELQAPHSNRSTIMLVLDVPGGDELFQPGDHLSVFPENNTKLVEELLECVDLTSITPDDHVTLEFNKGGEESNQWQEEQRFCQEVTIRDALAKYLDITTPPTPELLKLLAVQTINPEDSEGLQILGKGEREYEEWKYNHYPHLVEVICCFPSLRGKIDPAFLLSQLPILQSRYYSISSSPNLHPGEVHITVAVVKYQVKPFVLQARGTLEENEATQHFGVCSNWLSKIEPGTDVPCFFRKAANFHMPTDPATPIIMVGPGTGLAPFRSFWQERIHQLKSRKLRTPTPNAGVLTTAETAKEDAHALSEGATEYGQMYLFFGCRQSTVDLIYSDEMLNAKQCGALDEYYVALSREPEKPKTYVQHHLQEKADMLVKLLDAAHVYVCGDASMARDVLYTTVNLLMSHAAMSQQEARNFVDAMKEAGRYHEDIFGVTLRTAEVTDRFRSAAKRKWNLHHGEPAGITNGDATEQEKIPR